MQSGITASAELQDAFSAFTADTSLFALPITIASESLQPSASAIAFTSSSFESSLASLKPHLQPKTPSYLILRPNPSQSHGLIAVAFVPSDAPVRSKMLFASTRTTLTRDLGLEKFGDSVFATDDFEILDPAQWSGRTKANSTGGHGEDILTTEERELQSVRRAEDAERHGTKGRDLMGAGGSGGRLAMKISSDAKSALPSLSESGAVVQLGIDVSSETLELISSKIGMQPEQTLSAIPVDRPSYTFYHYPETEDVLFIYTCPGSSKVKERMVYASARAGALQAAQSEGVAVTKRLEQGDANEIDAGRLAEEVGIKSASETVTKQGFSKPKRPGRR